MGKKNVPNLLGEGVEEEVLKDIIKIIHKNPYILEIKNEKAVFIGTQKFKFFSEISFNVELLNKEIIEDYKENIDRITY